MSSVMNLNPWLTMWTQPRVTIRHLLLTNPSYGVFWIVSLNALQAVFFYANWWSLALNVHYRLILSIGIILSPLIGMLWLYVSGFVFYLTGRLMKGRAPFAHLRTCIAWSLIPHSISLLMWLILIFVSYEGAFIHNAEGSPSIFVNLIYLIVAIWSFVLLVQSIREAQRFSVAKTILNIFLVSMINSLIFFMLFSVFRLIIGLYN